MRHALKISNNVVYGNNGSSIKHWPNGKLLKVESLFGQASLYVIDSSHTHTLTHTHTPVSYTHLDVYKRQQ